MAYERESGGGGFDGRFGRGKRPVTDYGSSMVLWMRNRRDKHLGLPNVERERPSPSYIVDMLPPAASRPSDCIPAKFLHSSLNKVKHPINVVKWTPEGRRLLTASSSGEFTLWNGMGFNFETIMQAHDSAIRAVSYSHDDNWLISGDHDGYVKFWQPNFNNVQVIEAHKDPIRDLAFAPTDVKFATASDDATIKIWDFNTGKEELTITGHNWEVKSVDWNPVKGLIASGSKDHLIKLWDPRNGRCLTTFHNHKNTISKVLFDPKRGDILATCARDQTARIFDLRMMRDVVLLRGHDKDVQTLTFHPNYANLVSTGGSDGTLFHYLLDEQHAPQGVAHTISPYDSADPKTHPTHSIWPRHKVPFAHDWAIWSLDWHPLGHILASGSNDRITRFWTRNRPGDTAYINDRYHIGEAAAEAQGTWDRRGGKKQLQEQEEREYEDEAEGLVDQKMPPKQAQFPGIPGLPGLPSTANDGTSQGGAQPQFPGMGAVPPPPPPGGLPGLGIPNLDPSNPPNLKQLASLLGNLPPGSLPPMPPPIPGMAGVSGFPPPPPLPANFPGGVIPPGLLPPGFKLPPGFPQGVPPPPPPLAGGGLPGLGPSPMWHDGAQESKGGAVSSIRKRAPLPSQEESLAEEKRRGKYRTAR